MTFFQPARTGGAEQRRCPWRGSPLAIASQASSVLALQHLHRDEGSGVAVELGHAFVDTDGVPEVRGERPGGLHGAPHRAGPHRVHALGASRQQTLRD